MGNEYDLKFDPVMKVDVASLICAMKRKGDTRTKYLEDLIKIKQEECASKGMSGEDATAESYFAAFEYIEGHHDLWKYMHTFNPCDIKGMEERVRDEEKRQRQTRNINGRNKTLAQKADEIKGMSIGEALYPIYANKLYKKETDAPQKIPTCEDVFTECRSGPYVDLLLDELDERLDYERAETLAKVRERARLANQDKTEEEQEIETDLAVWDFCETHRDFRDLFNLLVKIKSFENI